MEAIGVPQGPILGNTRNRRSVGTGRESSYRIKISKHSKSTNGNRSNCHCLAANKELNLGEKTLYVLFISTLPGEISPPYY